MTTDYAMVGVKNKVKDRCPQTKVGLFFFFFWAYGGGDMYVESRKSAHRRRWDYFQ